MARCDPCPIVQTFDTCSRNAQLLLSFETHPSAKAELFECIRRDRRPGRRQRVHRGRERRRVHVIRVRAKTFHAPARVGRIRPGAAAASEVLHPSVRDAVCSKAALELLAPELWVAARSWKGPDIDELPRPVR